MPCKWVVVIGSVPSGFFVCASNEPQKTDFPKCHYDHGNLMITFFMLCLVEFDDVIGKERRFPKHRRLSVAPHCGYDVLNVATIVTSHTNIPLFHYHIEY